MDCTTQATAMGLIGVIVGAFLVAIPTIMFTAWMIRKAKIDERS